MKNRHLVSTVAIIAVFAFVAAFGCSRKKTIETEEGKISFTEKGDTFKIETDRGTLTMKSGKLPANLSRDIPIYEPSNVAMSQVLDGGKNVILSLSTKDSSAKVKKFYEEAMTKNGWKINRRMSMGPATVLSGSKGPSRLNVTMNQEEGGTVISLAFEGK